MATKKELTRGEKAAQTRAKNKAAKHPGITKTYDLDGPDFISAMEGLSNQIRQNTEIIRRLSEPAPSFDPPRITEVPGGTKRPEESALGVSDLLFDRVAQSSNLREQAEALTAHIVHGVPPGGQNGCTTQTAASASQGPAKDALGSIENNLRATAHSLSELATYLLGK